MSRSGFGLLIGWLTEGTGGEATGVGHGFSGERGRRGRAAVMRVVNNHVQFESKLNEDFISANTTNRPEKLPRRQFLLMHGKNPQAFFLHLAQTKLTLMVFKEI